MTSYEEISKSLEPWFCKYLGVREAEICELKRHTEGWSWHTYSMTVNWTDPSGGGPRSRGFVIRRQPEEGLLPWYDIQSQFNLHRAVLRESDVPMPELHCLEMDPGILGMPFYVMDRVKGIVPLQWRGKDPSIFQSEGMRHTIGLEFVEVLAKIHAIDYKLAFVDLTEWPETSEECASREIDKWERLYESSALFEIPSIRDVIGWLRRNSCTSGRLALCHGDYRIGNFMLRDGRIVAIFDWELAHVGDPVEDIAWSGLPLFRGRSPLLSQLLAKEEFLARYEELTGLFIEPEVFNFWTVFGFLKAAAPHIRACRAFEEGKAKDLRLAAMGHQTLYIIKQLTETLGFGNF